jgi:hypothetical protein
LAAFGGDWDDGDYAGVFRLYVNRTASNSNADYGGRLMYMGS